MVRIVVVKGSSVEANWAYQCSIRIRNWKKGQNKQPCNCPHPHQLNGGTTMGVVVVVLEKLYSLVNEAQFMIQEAVHLHMANDSRPKWGAWICKWCTDPLQCFSPPIPMSGLELARSWLEREAMLQPPPKQSPGWTSGMSIKEPRES